MLFSNNEDVIIGINGGGPNSNISSNWQETTDTNCTHDDVQPPHPPRTRESAAGRSAGGVGRTLHFRRSREGERSRPPSAIFQHAQDTKRFSSCALNIPLSDSPAPNGDNYEINLRDEDRRHNVEEASALRWRMGICGLAVTLLWITTLSLAQDLVTTTAPVPPLHSVFVTCQFAYNEVRVQQKHYEDCAGQQLSACARYRDEQLQEEVAYMRVAQAYNNNINSELNTYRMICKTSVDKVISSLRSFCAKISPPNEIAYQITCEADNHQRVKLLLGDKAAESSDALSKSSEYVHSSRDTVLHLANYASSLSEYNEDYLVNKTAHVRQELSSQMKSLSALNIDSFNNTLLTMQHRVDQAMACLSLDSSSFSECTDVPTSLLALYEEMQLQIESNRNALQSSLERIELYVTAYGNSAEAAMSKATQFYNSVSGAAGAMAWINTHLAPLSPAPISLCGIVSPSWCSFTPSMWYVPPPRLPFVPQIISVPNAATLWTQVKEAMNEVHGAGSYSASEVLAVSEAWSSSLLQLTADDRSLGLQDYQPPHYLHASDTAAEVESHDKQSESYLRGLSQSIASLSSSVHVNESSYDSDANFNFSSTTRDNMFAFSYHSYSFKSMTPLKNIDLLGVFQIFSDINQLLLYMDVVFRIFQTVRLLRMYWDKSAVCLPVVDMTDSLGAQQPAPGTVSLTHLLYKSFVMFSSVWLAIGWMLLITVLVLYSVAAVYIPAYRDYQDTCVSHRQNETFLSANLYAAAYNLASDKGNSAILRGLSDYNSVSSKACSHYTSEARRSFDALVKDLHSSSADHEETTAARVKLLSSCVNFTEMDKQVTLLNGSSWPLYTYLSAPEAQALSSAASAGGGTRSCGDPLLSHWDYNVSGMLKGAEEMFNCTSALPTCTLSCKGPETNIVRVLSKRCSCMGEWFVHSSLMNSLAVLVVYVLLNLSRYCLCRAICIYFWRKMTTDRSFLFVGSSHMDGTVVVPASLLRSASKSQSDTLNSSIPPTLPLQDTTDFRLDIQDIYAGVHDERNFNFSSRSDVGSMNNVLQNNSNSALIINTLDYKESLRAKLTSSLTWFRWKGHLFLLSALVMNSPWVIFLLFVNARLTYDPYE